MMSIVLFERLDTVHADKLLDTLQNHEGDFILDGHLVQHLGGKCLVALLRIKECAEKEGRGFCIIHPSDVLRSDLELLGLSKFLLKLENS
ncbi:STAS domain-containing protein [Neokomagataea anthophila]|uniref:STAS domain-containing protein n=1 Tax=Neokomagataea anthophila TaxID=2826925 RepID=A0ABS5E3F8_9PROT|nr:hypothetical protein [Neokomagataea anthophila]MBR0558447.1 hypothetical protein [Neokomagataea anthophila]